MVRLKSEYSHNHHFRHNYLYFRLEDQIDVSEKLFDTYPILIYPCRIYDSGLGQLRAPRKGIEINSFLKIYKERDFR